MRYERLVLTATARGELEASETIYTRAKTKYNPSWQCRKGLATVQYEMDNNADASLELQSILKEYDSKSGHPSINDNKLVGNHLQLSEYAYGTENMLLAREQYSEARKRGTDNHKVDGILADYRLHYSQPTMPQLQMTSCKRVLAPKMEKIT